MDKAGAIAYLESIAMAMENGYAKVVVPMSTDTMREIVDALKGPDAYATTKTAPSVSRSWDE